jgi:hypothetical protein
VICGVDQRIGVMAERAQQNVAVCVNGKGWAKLAGKQMRAVLADVAISHPACEGCPDLAYKRLKAFS